MQSIASTENREAGYLCYIASNRVMIESEELWRIRKKVVRTYFEIKSQESLGETEEIDDNHSLNIRLQT
jgi:hypothetical protein